MRQPDWQKDKYLKTPEHFSDTVDACVRQQLAKPAAEPEKHMRLSANTNNESRGDTMMGSNKRPFKAFGWRKAVACAAALVIVIGGSAWAATQFQLERYMGNDPGNGAQSVQEHIEIIEEMDQSVESDLPELLRGFKTDADQIFMEPLVSIKEVYFDGSVLYIYGESTEDGKVYDLGTSRIFVNGVQYVGELQSTKSYNGTSDNPYAYVGRIQLAEARLTEDFTVQIPFTVYKRFEGNVIGVQQTDGEVTSEFREYIESGTLKDENGNAYNPVAYEDILRLGFQTISFNVSVTDNKARILDDQTVEIDHGRVDISMLTISPSTLHIRYTWRLNGDDARQKAEALSISGMEMKDNIGNSYDSLSYSQGGTSLGCEVYQDETGAWCTEKDYYLKGVPMDITSLTITPYAYKDIDNLDLSRTEDLAYGSFTLDLN